MSFEDDFRRWHRASGRVLNLRQTSADSFFTDVNVILDELNSLDFSGRVVSRNEEAWPILSKLSALVPSNGTNDLLATKLCQLVVNLLSRQKLTVNQETCDALLKFLSNSIQSCQKWALPNHLRALGAVLYENGPMCSKFAQMLLANNSPEGLLPVFVQAPGWSIDVRCCAISCTGNICMKTPNGSHVEEEHVTSAFLIVLDAIQYKPQSRMENVEHYSLVLSALRALQSILVVFRTVDKAQQQPLLAALKNCMLCGLPGYKPCFMERSKLAQSGSLGMQPDDLSSINLQPMAPKSRSYQNVAAINKKKKKRSGQRKDKTFPQTSTSYPGHNLKFPKDHYSVDAMTPSFARTHLKSTPLNIGPSQVKPTAQNVPCSCEVTNEVPSGTLLAGASVNGTSLGPMTEGACANQESAASQESSSEGFSATSSDSDFSDSEAGQAARLRSITSKVRQAALGCLQTVVKGMDKKVMFGYWSSFIPDSTIGTSWSLFSTILRDSAPRARASGVAVLSELLDGSRQLLAAADDREEPAALLSRRPFTSFSVRLGGIVHELHRCLLQALVAETFTLTKLLIMKCLSVLVLNSPYNRLREGLLTRVVRQIKPLIPTKDVNLRVTIFTCLGMVVSVQAPLPEVIELMKSQASRPSSGIHNDNRATQTTANSSATSESSKELDNPALQRGLSDSDKTLTSQDNSFSAEGKEMPPHDLSGVTENSTKSKSSRTWSILDFRSCGSGAHLKDYLDPPECYPWIVTSCVNVVAKRQGRETQPLAVRVEAIQVLTAFVRNYFALASPSAPCLTSLACSCLQEDEQSIALFGIKLLEELAKTMYSFLDGKDEMKQPEVIVTKEQLLVFWLELLQGPLLTILQSSNSKETKLTSTAIDCLSNIGAQVFEILPVDKRILCITLLLGLSNDEDKNIKASAVRAVGVLVLYPCLREDVLFVADTSNAILTCMEDGSLAVKMRAAWSLGNLSDTLVANKFSDDPTFVEDFSDMLLLKLLDLAITASDDHEKVKSNAVRALGNILRYVTPSTLEKRGFLHGVERAVQALTRNVGAGVMKVRWNACYAIGNVFRNTSLPMGTAAWTGTIYTALENVIRDCKNFKVRINAVLSLSMPQERRCYGDVHQFVGVMETIIKALEATNTLTEFTEFKYRDTLREQLCNTLCHLASLVTVEDLVLMSPMLESNKAVLEQFVVNYATVVLSQSSEENPVYQEKDEIHTKDSYDKLKTLVKAQTHVFEELDSNLPGAKILREVLDTKKIPEPAFNSPCVTSQ